VKVSHTQKSVILNKKILVFHKELKVEIEKKPPKEKIEFVDVDEIGKNRAYNQILAEISSRIKEEKTEHLILGRYFGKYIWNSYSKRYDTPEMFVYIKSRLRADGYRVSSYISKIKDDMCITIKW